MEAKNSVLKDKSKIFAVGGVKLYQYLSQMKKEIIMSKQLLRAETAIGALLKKNVTTNHYLHGRTKIIS